MPKFAVLLWSSLMVLALSSPAFASERGGRDCQHAEYSRDPMVWNEGYGVSSCKRVERRYDTYRGSKARPRNAASWLGVWGADKWKGSFGGYDQRSDDRYDRRGRD
jgi:hypothetical protein